jgi:hypothetical protein
VHSHEGPNGFPSAIRDSGFTNSFDEQVGLDDPRSQEGPHELPILPTVGSQPGRAEIAALESEPGDAVGIGVLVRDQPLVPPIRKDGC